MPTTQFAVTRFENRNGTVSWNVSGLLAGVRIRKNFKTRESPGCFASADSTSSLSRRLRERRSNTYEKRPVWVARNVYCEKLF